MKRIFLISLVGVVIIGGATASAMVQIDCTQCGGAGVVDCSECRAWMICPHCDPQMVYGGFIGDPDCPQCGGSGTITQSTGFVDHRFEVECGCRGKNPECPFCRGRGSYSVRTTRLCEACQGEGGQPCPHCDGRGKIRLNEKILQVMALR
ncbi:MAG: hypothetical protein R6U93_03985 [Dehalococcoidia bacterium]